MSDIFSNVRRGVEGLGREAEVQCHDRQNLHGHCFHFEFHYNHPFTRSLVVGLPLTWTMSSISLAPGLTISFKAEGKGLLEILSLRQGLDRLVMGLVTSLTFLEATSTT